MKANERSEGTSKNPIYHCTILQHSRCTTVFAGNIFQIAYLFAILDFGLFSSSLPLPSHEGKNQATRPLLLFACQ